MAVYAFDYTAWAALYPALAASYNEAAATGYFNQAQYIILDNTDASPVQDVNQRGYLFGLLIAHLMTLDQRSAAGGMVGNVTGASEGSVSVQIAAYSSATDPGKWFEQTQPGALYWQATNQFRRAIYFPGRHAYTGVPRYVGGGR